ncbi:NAD(P)-dependent glycerol-3-phosphate dehydrogenase [Reichenbachiella agarivorans]|uniref:Glycerol-3-phosphate dehydrogenase [NAD(P)+] n=1 Tax=Reichenbachiella agarivorans TaxID=2979464 RepID=A0ABY6CPU3_9BACT|nr:NAD(P)H-dependent glycerol-3-phosphate dehydrogenase [Reichenbachiella agarivorans]UXP32517.1 NAD(P)-dependent glycerol-3-phosphate dehydrogenase [Reichenbachiella agarivorans]
MISKNTSKKPVGVIGAGSFGTAIANILAEKSDVLLYVRDKEKAKEISSSRISSRQHLEENINITSYIEDIGNQCEVIFPIVPSANFRQMIKSLAPSLRPYHILIHGTKGLDLNIPEGIVLTKENPLSRKHVRTMSEVILEETSVLRVGCLAGPNLAKEIEERQPAATVVASHFEEVIDIGQKLLKNDRFMVYGSNDLIGIEFCGVLKNIIAIGSGAVSGMGLGENTRSLLISRGMVEMIHIGNALGGNTKAFIGLAGVGDLIATCTSKLSRNFTVGFRLAQGESIDQIKASMEEVAEGINTIEIIRELAESLNIRVPITETLHKIIHGKMTVAESHTYFMKFPFRAEIDFI